MDAASCCRFYFLESTHISKKKSFLNGWLYRFGQMCQEKKKFLLLPWLFGQILALEKASGVNVEQHVWNFAISLTLSMQMIFFSVYVKHQTHFGCTKHRVRNELLLNFSHFRMKWCWTPCSKSSKICWVGMNFKYGFRLARSFWLEMLWDASAVNDVSFVVHIKGIIVLMFYVGQKGLFVV